eukprot:250924_1
MSLKDIYLLDSNNSKHTINSLFKFGRQTKGYSNLSPRISRIHFEIEPANHVQHCAQLTLKGQYIMITSNGHTTEYTQQNKIIFLKHKDKIDLVSNKYSNEQFSFTIYDSTQPNTSNPKKRNINQISENYNQSYSSQKHKRQKTTHNSIIYDYNLSLSHSNTNQLINNNSSNNNNQLSLSGLMISPSPVFNNHSNHSSSHSSFVSTEHNKYNQLPSFPNVSNNKNSQSDNDLNSENILTDANNNKNHNISSQKQEVQDVKMKELEDTRLQNEAAERDRKLFEDGRYSLALPILFVDRYKFDIDRTLNVIAYIIKQFMSVHRHPDVRIIVIATNQYYAKLYKKLRLEYKIDLSQDKTSSESVSLELQIDDGNKYKLFEFDKRIIIYKCEWEDIIKLKDNGLCCQYIVNFAFWNFNEKKGDKLNKLINKYCVNLSEISISKHKTAKKRCVCYPVEINSANGGDLYNKQNIRNILQIRPPSMNEKLQDYIKNKQYAYKELHNFYSRILNTFYELTNLIKPMKDELVISDMKNWDEKQKHKVKQNQNIFTEEDKKTVIQKNSYI